MRRDFYTYAQSVLPFTPYHSHYSPSVNLTGNNKHATKNADGRVDGNHSTIYTSADILAHPSVQLTRGGVILIGLLSGGDYHPAGLSRCGPGIAHGLAKSDLGDELLEAAQSLTRDELPEFLARWRESLRNELRTNSRGHLGSKKPSLAKVIPDSFPDIDVLLSYTNPITSATDAGARRTHTPPRWDREPDLGKLAQVCELHFEWGLKDTIIKRFRTVLWPSMVLRALRHSALGADTKAARAPSIPTGEQESSHQDVPGTPSKQLARHFSSMALRSDGEDEDGILKDLIVKIHGSRMHAYTDGILEYRLEIAPAQLVCLASAGIQGLRKPADTTYDVLPSESEDSDEVDDEGGGEGTKGRKKRRGGGPPPEPDSHLRVWMPACMVGYVLPDLVEQYETALEVKRAKKSKSKVPRGTARAAPKAKGKGRSAPASKKAVEAARASADEECFDLNVSSSEESEGRTSPLPRGRHSRPLPTTSSQDDRLPTALPEKPGAAVVPVINGLFSDSSHSTRIQESPQGILDVISDDDDRDGSPGPSKTLKNHLPSPSKVLQGLDLNLYVNTTSSKARTPTTPPRPSFSHPRALRPFPIALEKEESSESDRDLSRPTTPNSYACDHLLYSIPTTPPASSPRAQLQQRPEPVVREEEEESSDDPDAMSGELPVLHPLRQAQSRTLADHAHSATLSPRHDSSSLAKRPSRQPSSSLSPSKVRRKSPQWTKQRQRSVQPTLPDDDELPESPIQLRRASETSVISISSDSDDEGDDECDGGLEGLLAPVAPLLIARSRTGVQKRSVPAPAITATVEPEVIDLT